MRCSAGHGDPFRKVILHGSDITIRACQVLRLQWMTHHGRKIIIMTKNINTYLCHISRILRQQSRKHTSRPALSCWSAWCPHRYTEQRHLRAWMGQDTCCLDPLNSNAHHQPRKMKSTSDTTFWCCLMQAVGEEEVVVVVVVVLVAAPQHVEP